MWVDWTSYVDTTIEKYISICLCLLFSVYIAIKNKPDGLILLGAFFFTVLSDTFTLVINYYYTLGVSLFIPAQLFYALRMRTWSNKPPYKSIIARVLLIITIISVLAITQSLDTLTTVTAIYFSLLISNAIESLFFLKNLNQILFSIGLWLFVCCDICVGLYNIPFIFNVNFSARFDYAVSVLMWGFYLPSQILIVFSANKNLIKTVDQLKIK